MPPREAWSCIGGQEAEIEITVVTVGLVPEVMYVILVWIKREHDGKHGYHEGFTWSTKEGTRNCSPSCYLLSLDLITK